MDLAPTSTKSPEPDSEIPTRIQPEKPVSFTNGVLKRHQAAAVVVTYKECLKNHAATLGGHALDGCGEFMPSSAADLKCAACGCHRNFHRRDPDEPPTHVLEFQPHHRHHPPVPHGSPNTSSPPPISSSAPHMLLALSAGGAAAAQPSPSSRKRFRTKFSQTQKEKMHDFAERVGWKMQKRDDDLVQDFCGEIGVERSVLKVWMHNNKSTVGGKRDQSSDGGENPDQNHRRSRNGDGDDAGGRGAGHHAATANGSSSSS